MKTYKIIKGIIEVLTLVAIPLSLILWIWGVSPGAMMRILATAIVLLIVQVGASLVSSHTKEHKKKTDTVNDGKPKRSKFAERLIALQKEKSKE